ncbi:nitric oxide synthase-interacting protein, partial [Cuculus canorus]|uniref:nitric oxide synthase-interacting protein n=1 Tax=Cuculus canorus TaxID=55661 RepID=UPI0023AACF5D
CAVALPAAASGYGTQRVRIGRDAIKDFDCCCLSLQPCRDPVVTPDGFLYEREAIVSYLLHRKAEAAQQRKAFERQRRRQRREQQRRSRAGAEATVRGFLRTESPLGAAGGDPEPPPGPSGSLPSFWIPSLTPEAAAEPLPRPMGGGRCPMSGRRLRLRDLVSVRFSGGAAGGTPRYQCAVTGDALSNATPCAVLRPSGAVVTMDCVERLIRKEMRDPLSGEPLAEGDIIVLQRGGTGFAGAGVCLEAEKSRPVMQA